MPDQDVVDPGDAALHELLASVAERTHDSLRRARILDYLITTPPLVEWSAEEREVLRQTCAYIISLARLNRELEHLSRPPARGK
ncbi:hypothetical protein ACQI5H_22815 [Mycobacterium heidelbergense]|uniref:hypothetical protein n=1 Tax=Mycobacterium heidelbergense TaxID=53376 RepID=UPI003CE688D0